MFGLFKKEKKTEKKLEREAWMSDVVFTHLDLMYKEEISSFNYYYVSEKRNWMQKTFFRVAKNICPESFSDAPGLSKAAVHYPGYGDNKRAGSVIGYVDTTDEKLAVLQKELTALCGDFRLWEFKRV